MHNETGMNDNLSDLKEAKVLHVKAMKLVVKIPFNEIFTIYLILHSFQTDILHASAVLV